MHHPSVPLWAFWNFEQMTQAIIHGNKIFLGIRIVVAVIGAALVFFLTSPIFKGLYYLFVRRAMPGLLHVPLRLVIAIVVAASLFYFLPVGSGGLGGLGSGGGQGDGTGPGKGEGKGEGDGKGDGKSTGTNPTDSTPSTGPENGGPERLSIVLLGGKDYKAEGKFKFGEGKYYLKTKNSKAENVKTRKDVEDLLAECKAEDVMTLKEVEDLLAERKTIAGANLIVTGQSVDGAPREKLEELFRTKKINPRTTEINK